MESINENVAVDKFLESNQTNLLPVDASYTGYEYEKITSSTAPGNWSGGVRAEFTFPQFEDSVWDTNDLYIDCVADIKLKTSTGAEGYPSPYATVAIEQMFTSGLLENQQINYGGIDLQNMQSPSDSFPYLSGVYTLINNKSVHTGGNARVLQWIPADGTPVSAGTFNAGTSREFYRLRRNDIINDAEDPYDLSVDKCYQDAIPVEENSFVTAVYDGTTPEKYMSWLNSGYIYRNLHTAGDKEVPAAAATVTNGYKLRFLMKIKDGFLNNSYKKPANIPLKISLTRNRNIGYALCGRADLDQTISRVTAGTDPTYTLKFDRMDMYCKRLFLSQNQLQVYRSSSLLMYDVPRWTIQVFNLAPSTGVTTQSININSNWTKKPETLFAAIVPNASLNPQLSGTGVFEKTTSSFSSSNRRLIDFEELSINTSIGQIPKHPYQLRDKVSATHNMAGVKRAYEDFKKACADPDKCITFSQWFENMRIYGFIINNDQANPHTQNSHPSRSTINVLGTVYTDDAGVSLADYSLVLIGMYYARLGVSDFKSVFMVT
jgi:hypothetical protein